MTETYTFRLDPDLKAFIIAHGGGELIRAMAREEWQYLHAKGKVDPEFARLHPVPPEPNE